MKNEQVGFCQAPNVCALSVRLAFPGLHDVLLSARFFCEVQGKMAMIMHRGVVYDLPRQSLLRTASTSDG